MRISWDNETGRKCTESLPLKQHQEICSLCSLFLRIELALSIYLTISSRPLSNSNLTEWSTIQGVIARVISKSDEREARGRFEITSTITP